MTVALKHQREIAKVLDLPYAREFVKNSDGSFFARVVEFPGCMTEGETYQEAFENLEDAITGWVDVHLQDGDPIPEPLTAEEYSGKFLVRMPNTLHRDLARRAELEDVSLNQYVLMALSRYVGK
jgi:antitoxin HicB